MTWVAWLAAAIEADMNTDPDTDPVTIRSAYRDLNCKLNGEEVFRRIRYPGQARGTEWPDSDRLPAFGSRASQRHAVEYCGTIVLDYERYVSHGRRGRCKASIGIVLRNPAESKAKIYWLERKILRSRPVYQIKTPARGTVEIEKRE